jgi:hypothetical protein
MAKKNAQLLAASCFLLLLIAATSQAADHKLSDGAKSVRSRCEGPGWMGFERSCVEAGIAEVRKICNVPVDTWSLGGDRKLLRSCAEPLLDIGPLEDGLAISSLGSDAFKARMNQAVERAPSKNEVDRKVEYLVSLCHARLRSDPSDSCKEFRPAEPQSRYTKNYPVRDFLTFVKAYDEAVMNSPVVVAKAKEEKEKLAREEASKVAQEVNRWNELARAARSAINGSDPVEKIKAKQIIQADEFLQAVKSEFAKADAARPKKLEDALTNYGKEFVKAKGPSNELFSLATSNRMPTVFGQLAKTVIAEGCHDMFKDFYPSRSIAIKKARGNRELPQNIPEFIAAFNAIAGKDFDQQVDAVTNNTWNGGPLARFLPVAFAYASGEIGDEAFVAQVAEFDAKGGPDEKVCDGRSAKEVRNAVLTFAQSFVKDAGLSKAGQEAKMASIRAGKAKPASVEEAVQAYSGQSGELLSGSAKAAPDNSYYFMIGEVQQFNGKEMLIKTQRGFAVIDRDAATVIEGGESNLREGSLLAVGRYVGNRKVTLTSGATKTAPILKSVYIKPISEKELMQEALMGRFK